MKFLKRVKAKQSYAEEIEKIIKNHFYESIFKPLIDILNIPNIETLNNAAAAFRPMPKALTYAINRGRIWYADGGFVGTFSAQITAELKSMGAKYDVKKNIFKIERNILPIDIRSALASRGLKEQEKAQKAMRYMDALKGREDINFRDKVGEIISDIESKIKANIPEGLAIPFELSPYARERIKDQYTYNLNLYIQKWQQEEIETLRLKVEKNVASGFRAESLQKDIQHQYGVSARKAKFLARQETQLLTAKYSQARYQEAGLTKYRWRTMGDRRVRDSHRALNRRIFSFDNPPIVDSATGARANPSEYFNCRCWAEVLVK
jgi:SPP1 gp7 family putative phage head morphogenesis protein